VDDTATDIFKMLNKYRPESKEQKDERRKATAEKGAAAAKSKDQSVKCGINQIARLVESKKATMVIIAHDVSCASDAQILGLFKASARHCNASIFTLALQFPLSRILIIQNAVGILHAWLAECGVCICGCFAR